jgi:hypothetical protein
MMIEVVLNTQRSLSASWFHDYGLTSTRSRKLLAPHPDRNSFEHHESETALTLFMLGNLDGWKQVGHFRETGPRSQKGNWSQRFFSTACGPVGVSAYQVPGAWPILSHGVFRDTSLDWFRSILVFEFEVMNSEFHTVNGKAFKSLSFLNIHGNKKWGAFDAFMVVPSACPTERQKGVLIGFEAKLASDISRRTGGFPYVNQVMRNLEAGYWLTHHADSLYRNWRFQYVFLCPRQDFELKAAMYGWMLADETSRLKAADSYWRVLAYHGAVVDPGHFEAFRKMVRDSVTVLHWDQAADVLRRAKATFFNDYFQALGNHQKLDVVAAKTRRRFERAGIEIE